MKKLTILFLFISVIQGNAQQKLTKAQLDSLPNTIENYFTKAIGKAKKWNEYKMISNNDFKSLEKQVIDSVNLLKKNIDLKNITIDKLGADIKELNDKIENLNTDLKVYENANNAKKTQKGIIYSIIALLTGGLIFFIFKFKKSNIITKKSKENLIALEDEFEGHKKRSLEKEQQLRRKLQDEINKQRGV